VAARADHHPHESPWTMTLPLVVLAILSVVGVASVVREGYDDFHGLDPNDDHYDPKATQENPIWSMVDIKGERALPNPVTLDDIKANPKLKDMLLIRKGMRLSIQPVTKAEFDEVLLMGGRSKG